MKKCRVSQGRKKNLKLRLKSPPPPPPFWNSIWGGGGGSPPIDHVLPFAPPPI